LVLSVVGGYVEGWYVHKKVREAIDRSGKFKGTTSF